MATCLIWSSPGFPGTEQLSLSSRLATKGICTSTPLATMEFEKTYAMIKPDAVKAGKAEEICQLIEVHGFTIIAKQKLQASLPSC